MPSKHNQILILTDQAYRVLLAAYPDEFRQRFGAEMVQVFRTCCRAAYRDHGSLGVRRLWLPTLWDWAWSAARERFSNLFRRSAMNDTLAFERQLGDLAWSITTGLRAGYPLAQVIEAISINAPEPTASAFKRLHADLGAGLSLEQGLANLQKAVPSECLGQVIAAMLEDHETGWMLANRLETLVEGILEQFPSDGAFYPAMREEATQLGAQVPERVKLIAD